jgi:hypothetical protein
MRLYRIIGAAWAGTQADAKRSAGEHSAPWHETDVPTDKPGLLAWLNDRNVPARTEELELLEAARVPLERDPMDVGGEEKPWVMGPATKDPPRVPTSFLGDHTAGVEFVPVTRAAAIAASYRGCPKCQRTWTAQVLMGIAEASIEDLQSIAERIKDHLAELNQQLDQAGEARQ